MGEGSYPWSGKVQTSVSNNSWYTAGATVLQTAGSTFPNEETMDFGGEIFPTICANTDGTAAATSNNMYGASACACKNPHGTVADAEYVVFGGERACTTQFCTTRRAGYTFQGIPTCSATAPTYCMQNAGNFNSDLSLTNKYNNGTTFLPSHSQANGGGMACLCGNKICGAGRACVSSNSTNWKGIYGDGPLGNNIVSDQCLTAIIGAPGQEYCAGGNGTVAQKAYKENTGLYADNGKNEACFCDTQEATLCGAGRLCLNETTTGYNGPAECLSEPLHHCSNDTGSTVAYEACVCTDDLICGQGQFCVNSTGYTTSTTAGECLKEKISPCLNFTKELGKNNNACTCGPDTCAAGDFCNRNITCLSVPPKPSSGGYEKPTIAFLTVVALVLSL